MKELFKDYLFQHHILVNGQPFVIAKPDIHFNVVMTLANRFSIRISKGSELATVQMIHDAEKNLGVNVPLPFYRGFPDTVRQMTPDQLLYDQLLHYAYTYGMGWFDGSSHSAFENMPVDREEDAADRKAYDDFVETMFREKAKSKVFRILSEGDALEELFSLLNGLCLSSRPLNIDDMDILTEAFKEYGHVFVRSHIACKRTVIELLYRMKDVTFAKRYLKLADTIKLLEYIQYKEYNSENLKKLNLKNQDRKLITRVIHSFFEEKISLGDELDCFTKRKIWCGLLHHIHFKPEGIPEEVFVDQIRSGKNYSYESDFERLMREGDPVLAARQLDDARGTGAVMRNLNYILSRCKTEREVKEVLLSCLK